MNVRLLTSQTFISVLFRLFSHHNLVIVPHMYKVKVMCPFMLLFFLSSNSSWMWVWFKCSCCRLSYVIFCVCIVLRTRSTAVDGAKYYVVVVFFFFSFYYYWIYLRFLFIYILCEHYCVMFKCVPLHMIWVYL